MSKTHKSEHLFARQAATTCENPNEKIVKEIEAHSLVSVPVFLNFSNLVSRLEEALGFTSTSIYIQLYFYIIY